MSEILDEDSFIRLLEKPKVLQRLEELLLNRLPQLRRLGVVDLPACAQETKVTPKVSTAICIPRPPVTASGAELPRLDDCPDFEWSGYDNQLDDWLNDVDVQKAEIHAVRNRQKVERLITHITVDTGDSGIQRLTAANQEVFDEEGRLLDAPSPDATTIRLVDSETLLLTSE